MFAAELDANIKKKSIMVREMKSELDKSISMMNNKIETKMINNYNDMLVLFDEKAKREIAIVDGEKHRLRHAGFEGQLVELS